MRIGLSPFFIISVVFIILWSSSRATEATAKTKKPRLRSLSNPQFNGVDEVEVELTTFWNRMLRRDSFSYSASYAYLPVQVSSVSPNKTEWPECVDEKLTCSECKSLIEQEGYPTISEVEILGPRDPATLDYRTDRVRVICNKASNLVLAVPIVG
jgi:hypothetical protein